MKMICRPQLPDSYRLYDKFPEKRRDMQHGAGLGGMWEEASPQIECSHRNRVAFLQESKRRDKEESANGFDPRKFP
jgi:hypothetical protein